MATVRVKRSHGLGAERARASLDGFSADLAKRGAKLRWNGHRADISGPGVSGHVQVGETDVEVLVELGLLARAAGVKADKLEVSIAKRLEAALAGEG